MEVARAPAASGFGKYTLVAKLATGGMAEIFLARLLSDGGFEKLVCIKRILPHLAKDPRFVAMFLDEARVVARISHPNVCQVFELGEISGQYYIAMEYLAGVPLAIFRRRDYFAAPPDARLVAGFGMQACEGLHHAHQLKSPNGESLGVVHRDISPQNLFVTLDGIVKVLDFGIAKVQDQSARTSTGAVKGTYCYMAPEQLRGEKIDRRVDVWALGTVLWESLAQRHLFKRETEFLTFQAITGDPIPDICELRPDVPPDVGEVIGQALSRDREGRFPTARAFGEALARSVLAIGGPLAAAAIADVVEGSFQSVLGEQQELLERARRGDTFDLESSNPLGGAGRDATLTPVSNLQDKLEEARAEVEAHVRQQRARRHSEGFGQSAPHDATIVQPQAMQAAQQPMQPMPPMPPMPTPMPMQQMPASGAYGAVGPLPTGAMNLRATAKLPWIVAIAAVLAAGVIVAVVMANKSPPAAAPQEPPVAMTATPAPAANAAPVTPPPAQGSAVATVAQPTQSPQASTPAPQPQPPAKKPAPAPRAPVPHEVATAPAPSGPPGYITIDSAPVYATIFIDGKSFGETPLVHISLPPGHHNVRAVSPSGTSRSLSISIESGKTAPVRRIEW